MPSAPLKVPGFTPVSSRSARSPVGSRAGLEAARPGAPTEQAQLAQLGAQADRLQAELGAEDADALAKRHIAALHEYNEVKDVALDLMNRIAHLRATTLAAVEALYDVPAE